MKIESSCAHCGRPIRLTVDSEMKVNLQDTGAEPLVFMPRIDWSNFHEPNILDAY